VPRAPEHPAVPALGTPCRSGARSNGKPFRLFFPSVPAQARTIGPRYRVRPLVAAARGRVSHLSRHGLVHDDLGLGGYSLAELVDGFFWARALCRHVVQRAALDAYALLPTGFGGRAGGGPPRFAGHWNGQVDARTCRDPAERRLQSNPVTPDFNTLADS
jgi:hypothetical protein